MHKIQVFPNPQAKHLICGFIHLSWYLVHMLIFYMVPSCENEIKVMLVKVKHQLNINFDSLDLAFT